MVKCTVNHSIRESVSLSESVSEFVGITPFPYCVRRFGINSIFTCPSVKGTTGQFESVSLSESVSEFVGITPFPYCVRRFGINSIFTCPSVKGTTG